MNTVVKQILCGVAWCSDLFLSSLSLSLFSLSFSCFQSMQMPGEHKDLYVSTTLSVVIFTTVVCGGLTEPMLSKMDMRHTTSSSSSSAATTDSDAEVQ